MIGGGANTPGENVGGAPPPAFGGAEFMQRIFTAIKQVMRNTMQALVKAINTRATNAKKAFLQLHPPTFLGESDHLVAED